MFLAALPLMLLAGCTPPADAPQDALRGDCGADRLQGLVGQPKAVVDSMTLPEGSRVLGPNQAVTMDFRPGRLNIEIGKDGRVARIGCY